MRPGAALGEIWEICVWFVSAEWMLAVSTHRSNGGGVVLGRALIASAVVFLGTLGVLEALDPAKTTELSLVAARELVGEKLTWYGGIFAATYFALYARFSSQWVYLAGVYNQIKAAEVRMKERGPAQPEAVGSLVQWKAGFIEDASSLHLVGKPIFASVILEWSRCLGVRKAFEEYSTWSRIGFDEIRSIAKLACPGYQRPANCDRTTCPCTTSPQGGPAPSSGIGGVG